MARLFNVIEASRRCSFSPCRRWRFELEKRWGDGPLIAFIALNPSTADEHVDDPTVRRMTGYAKDWEYGGLIVLNLFGWRSPYPEDLRLVENPVGEGNLSIEHLTVVRERVEKFVACWGVHGRLLNRGPSVIQRFHALQLPLYCLGTNKGGEPCHPLYLPKSRKLELFR